MLHHFVIRGTCKLTADRCNPSPALHALHHMLGVKTKKLEPASDPIRIRYFHFTYAHTLAHPPTHTHTLILKAKLRACAAVTSKSCILMVDGASRFFKMRIGVCLRLRVDACYSSSWGPESIYSHAVGPFHDGSNTVNH